MLKDEFFEVLFEMRSAKNKEKLIDKARKLALKIPEFKGWPKSPQVFWNVEAYGWEQRISKEVREGISKILKKKVKGKVVDLGSGSYPYVKSTLVDFSPTMLKYVPKSYKKVVADLNLDLPFKDNSFDAVIVVFLLDYLKNPSSLIKEMQRILRKGGKFYIVQGKTPLKNYYRMHSKHVGERKLKKLLSNIDFSTSEHTFGKNTILLAEAKV